MEQDVMAAIKLSRFILGKRGQHRDGTCEIQRRDLTMDIGGASGPAEPARDGYRTVDAGVLQCADAANRGEHALGVSMRAQG
jgi:hypothetical protein